MQGREGRGRLLDRHGELGRIASALDRLRAGVSSLVLVEGVAGAGKTVLLDEARTMFAGDGALVLAARGGEFERGFPYGVVRQLFGPVLNSLPRRDRRACLDGAAALAAPIVDPTSTAQPDHEIDTFAAQHGLYWLTANLAARRRLLVAVDDLHWSDLPSSRFLVFLARRLTGVPACLLIGHRTGEDQAASVLAELQAEPGAVVLRPTPLGVDAVGTLLVDALGGPAPIKLAQACRAATGGVPFLVRELVRSLADDGVDAASLMAEDVFEFGPPAVAADVVRRLSSRPAVLRVAEAAAVLGEDADLPAVARLAGLDEDAAVRAAERLLALGVLGGGQPLAFVHPIVRAAVYRNLSDVRRSHEHRRAAGLLHAAGAHPQRVALHLLSSGATRAPGMADVLVEAATQARSTGAPEDAARFLIRALAEPAPVSRRLQLLLDLGRAQLASRDAAAADTFRKGLSLAHGDGVWRARLTLALCEALVTSGAWADGAASVDPALLALGNRDAELRTRLLTYQIGFAAYDPRLVDQYERGSAALIHVIRSRLPRSRAPAAIISAVDALRLAEPRLTTSDTAHGLDLDALIAEEGIDSPVIGQVFVALAAADDPALWRSTRAILHGTARQRGSVFGSVLAYSISGYASSCRGDLIEAEADLRLAIELCREHGIHFAVPTILHAALDVLAERPEVDDLAALAREVELPPDFAGTFSGVWLAQARARVLIRQGLVDEGIEELRYAGAISERGSWCHPLLSCWRAELAHSLASRDRTEAITLATQHYDLARRAGGVRVLGIAMCTLGTVTGGSEGLQLLERAAEVLRPSTARLELARARIQLGAALRRANRRAEAREPLREGLDLARRCGATRSVEQARAELAATGARLTREAISGVESLTPSQRRVADLAAQGLSNPQIAQALYVTRNTVETHLRAVFAKLGTRTRAELATLLGERA